MLGEVRMSFDPGDDQSWPDSTLPYWWFKDEHDDVTSELIEEEE